MNRKIMFRGKSVDDGGWVVGSLLVTDDNKNNPMSSRIPQKRYQVVTYFAGDWNMGGWGAIDVDPATVGQFTGLTDKNGKEIFEGDIIECLGSKNDPCRHIVRYSDERGGYVQYLFQAERITVEPFDCGQIWQQYITDREKYVIGNIHDNKV